ncbi:MAG: iron-sulfur cluster assembly scaffold protein [Clostridia bacterium]|nr:iron-sulfur cluster assembly scaffold protein [Clostridia bacterium]
MDCKNFKGYGASPIPQENMWVQAKEIKDISGFSHGCGKCAPQQGTCKLSLNVKNGVIKEALIETIGCSGMTHSSAMACEILVGKTILEALNTDLVCDAINDAMKQIFLQLVYGRSQSAFSDGGLEVGSGLEDLGKHLSSNISTVYGSENGTKYLQLAEGYITRQALDKNGEIIGYEYINPNMLIELLQAGIDKDSALRQSTKTYGRFAEGETFINPREVK